jgi:hypothetical protein
MSSTGQATPSTSSTSNIQLITNALADYAKITGVDLSKNPEAGRNLNAQLRSELCYRDGVRPTSGVA